VHGAARNGVATWRESRQVAPAEPAGYIFNIMRYALHDGPGIRTTVFFKGCPLRCAWCHNPEGQNPKPELMYFADRCLRCGDCIPVCREGASKLVEGVVHISPACRGCGTCVEQCPTGARELAGRRMTVVETLREIEKDVVFYDESGGGVTFSGGEPLLQPRFLEALLDACRARRIHTVVDTCGFASRDVVLQLGKKADLFFYDLKLVDVEKHMQATGVRNDTILENLAALAQSEARVVVRVPIIPGLNDSEEDIARLAAFLGPLPLEQIHLLPYHKTAIDKYRRLRREYRLGELQPPPPQHVQQIAEDLKVMGFDVRIGGER
jgi:pyruvate formate lyase activating enzyme